MNNRQLIQLLLLVITLGFALSPFLFPAPHTPPSVTEFNYNSELGEYIGGGNTGQYSPATAKFSLSGNLSALTVLIKYSDGYWQLKFNAPKGEKLQLGRVERIEPSSYQVDKLAALQVMNTGVECNTYFGNFTINQLVADNNGVITSFDATFMQRCESNTAPPITGSIKYNAPLTTHK